MKNGPTFAVLSLLIALGASIWELAFWERALFWRKSNEWMNIALGRFLHNHGNISTKSTPSEWWNAHPLANAWLKASLESWLVFCARSDSKYQKTRKCKIPSKYEAMTQCSLDVGPPSSTAGQHQDSIGSLPRGELKNMWPLWVGSSFYLDPMWW